MKLANSLKGKLNLRMGILLCAVFFLLLLLFGLGLRQFAIYSSRDSARQLMYILKSYGTQKGHSEFFSTLENLDFSQTELLQISVTPSNQLLRQIQQSRIKKLTDLEESVLKTGQEQSFLDDFTLLPSYEISLPLRASAQESTGCQGCHTAQEGEIMAIMTAKFNLSILQRDSFLLMAWVILLFVAAMVGTLLLSQRFFQPYLTLFKQLEFSFEETKQGRNKVPIQTQMEDEIGQMVQSYNQMQERVWGVLQDISTKTHFLVGYQFSMTKDIFLDTTHKVDQLVRIYNFKRKNDSAPTIEAIYSNLRETFLEMNIQIFSVFEGNFSDGTMMFRTSSMPPNFRVGDKKSPSETTQTPGYLNCGKVARHPESCWAIHQNQIYSSFDKGRCCSNIDPLPSQEQGHICIPVRGHNIATVGVFILPQPLRRYSEQVAPLLLSYFQETIKTLELRYAFKLIQEQAYRDQLTGLYNRRYLDLLEQQGLFNQDSIGDIGILLMDIDHFKQTNDTYGHAMGDQVLIKIAQCLKVSVRESDVVIRFGGEEILVLLFGIKSGEALRQGEKLRRAVADLRITQEEHTIQKTCSIGVAELPQNNPDLWSKIKLADQALYQAKDAGRNQVIMLP